MQRISPTQGRADKMLRPNETSCRGKVDLLSAYVRYSQWRQRRHPLDFSIRVHDGTVTDGDSHTTLGRRAIAEEEILLRSSPTVPRIV